jgi:uncharacterized membrane protein (UPF0136 family)
MKTTATILLVYATILFVGGLIGYIQAGSLPSLISGTLFSLLLDACAIAILRGKLFAQYLALGITFFLDGFFTYRFAKTLNFLPSGLMSLVSLIVIIVLALKIRKTQRVH